MYIGTGGTGQEGPAGSVVHSWARGTQRRADTPRQREVPWNLHHAGLALSL